MNIRTTNSYFFLTSLFLIALLIITVFTSAQGFRRNKPNYRNFDLEVYQSFNYEICHELTDDSVTNRIGNLSEK